MKINKAITEAIINYIYFTFEKETKDLGELKVLLIGSGVSKLGVSDFLKEGCKHKISYQKLEEEMASNDQFFFSLSSNLLPYLEKEQRNMFQQMMRKFGYILGVNRQFRKGKKAEFQDYSGSKTIEKIGIYKDEATRRFRISVNNQLIPWLSPHGNTEKHYWDYLFEIAKSGESEIIDVGKANGIEQWFNCRKDNPIYKYTGLTPARIIERKSEFFFPAPGVTIKELSLKKAYSKTVR